MADDIVTRLRLRAAHATDDYLSYAAADEIERLRAEVNSMASAQAGWGRVARLNDEIERLRAAGDALVAAIRTHDLREDHIKAWEEARRGPGA